MFRRVLTVAASAALLLPAIAEAHRGDGVFTLAEGRWLNGRDVAMLPDGSIVGVDPWRAWRLTPDGRRTPIPGLGGTGVAATPDGGVLVIQGISPDQFGEFAEDPPVGRHRIVRWTPDGGVSVVAGTGEPGFGGDGGPATQALVSLTPSSRGGLLDSPTGIVNRPDGGFAFADMGNGRIRVVDSAGVVRTVAGTLGDPVGLAATPDGGYVVTEGGTARVRRIAADGATETIATGLARDVVVSRGGAVIIAALDGRMWRLRPAARTLRPYLRPERMTETFDFAARSVLGWNLGLDAHGGLLAVDRGILSYVPRGLTPWTLAALRGTRTERRAVTAVMEATQPGVATVEIAQGQRIIARTSQPVSAGHSTLRAAGRIRDEWYDVRLVLEGPGGATARDEVPVHGANALTVELARRLLGRYQGQAVDDDVHYRLARDCRRFGRRRVDCAIATREDGGTVGVASVTLERSGVVLRRNYAWGRQGFRRHPHFIVGFDGEHTVQRLSRGHGGRWDWGP